MKTLWRSFPCQCLTFTFALVLFAVGGSVAWADSGTGTFLLLAASGPFCSVDPSFCPDITRAANGETIEISGAGTLSIHPKSVAGGGTFTHKNPAGGVIAFGVWTARELLSFRDYGTSPDFPATVHGGLAIIRVHLTPSTAERGLMRPLRSTAGLMLQGPSRRLASSGETWRGYG